MPAATYCGICERHNTGMQPSARDAPRLMPDSSTPTIGPCPAAGTGRRREAYSEGVARTKSPDHHSVYVVYLRNPKGDGKAGYYVGMTGLAPT
jgi:hypothetical protein